MHGKVTAGLMQPFHQMVKGWDRFWFAPADPLNTSVIRILAGWMIVYTHFIWGTHFSEFFGDEGWNSRAYLSHLQAGTATWSFWWYVPESWKFPVHCLCMLVLLSFFLGAWTRVTSVLTWLIAVAYSTRAALSNYGLDQINCILLMYLMLAPCGQYFSIDAWLRKRKGQPSPAPSVMANVSMRLIQIHLCIIYMWAGLGKLQGEAWWDGRAIWQALASYEYQSMDLTFLAVYPALLSFITHLTIAWEVYFPALVCNRSLRPFALLLGVGMHLGIGAFLGMWTFGTAMTFGYLTFVPPQVLRNFLNFVRSKVFALAGLESLQDNVTSVDASLEASQTLTPEPQPAPVWQPAVAVAAQRLIPFRGTVPNVILIVRGAANRKRLSTYLHSHALRLLIVDGLTEAGALAHVNPESVVLDIDSKLTESELNVLCQWIRHQNPQTRFVFVGQSPHFRNDDPGTIIVERNCALRQIRTAIEELTGWSCERSQDEPVQVDRPHEDNDQSRAEMEPSLSAEKSTTNRPVMLKTLAKMNAVLLIGVSMFSGCQQQESPRMMLERVRLLNDNNQTEEALSVIGKMLQREPRDADALYQRGVAFERRDEGEKAIEAYTECLSHAPDFAEALNNRGIVYGLQGKPEKSLEDIQAATLVKPDVSLFWSNLALVQTKLGRYDQAIESCLRAQHRNDDIRIEMQKANMLSVAGRYAEAITAYSKVVDTDKRHTAAWLNRASVRFKLGQTELALEDLQSATNCDTEFTFAPHIAMLREKIQSQPEALER